MNTNVRVGWREYANNAGKSPYLHHSSKGSGTAMTAVKKAVAISKMHLFNHGLQDAGLRFIHFLLQCLYLSNST